MTKENSEEVGTITNASNVDEVLAWLNQTDKILSHAATAGLPSLPNDALAAVNTIKTALVDPWTLENGTTESLVRDMRVLPKLLELIPSIYKMGYWYKPIAEWGPVLTSIWNKPVGIAKWMSHYDWDSYNTALNATSLIIRFTKDHERNATKASKGYAAYLPGFVAQLSTKVNFTLSETQLQTYMDALAPSNSSSTTEQYQNADVVALKAFIWGERPQ
uniref:Uncharacterized protein n=1 Tax=Globisporangium ultimum (strain ATCC 200006 / CBS 805.95 / DAOM BR144) TaxID=431595 RepID=K3WNR7_GLOUD